MAMTNQEVYDKVTADIIAQLQKGVVPWAQPWTNGNAPVSGQMPRNASSRRAYSGVNVLVLWTAAMARGYTSSGWVTFKQAIERGAVVRKGEKGTAVIYMNKFDKKEKDADGNETTRPIFFARLFTVFNLDQLDDLKDKPGSVDKLRARIGGALPKDSEDGNDIAPLDACDAIIKHHAPSIKHGGDRAFYSPLADFVQMPPKKSFKNREGYFGTLFHELIHWTGHSTRLDRMKLAPFGSPDYALEELVAELGAAMLAARTGVQQLDQSAAYLKHWLDVLTRKAQPGELTGTAALVKCATLASAAAEFLAPMSFGTADDEE